MQDNTIDDLSGEKQRENQSEVIDVNNECLYDSIKNSGSCLIASSSLVQSDSSKVVQEMVVNENTNHDSSLEKNIVSKQQSLEEELLMEEELLKGEDDDVEVNLNSDDLALDDDTIEASQLVKSSTESQDIKMLNDNNELDVNIDSLLRTPCGLADDNLDVDINEAELLKDSEAMADAKDDSNSRMIYDEDSLLRELNSNVNSNSENDLFGSVANRDATAITLCVDSQMTDVTSSVPMDETGVEVDTGQINDSLMEESALLMEDDDADADISATPMEENTLLADTEMSQDVAVVENDGQMDVLESVERVKAAVIDENNLLEDTAENIPEPNANDVDENVLLTDETNDEEENYTVTEDASQQEVINGATSGVQHIDLSETQSNVVALREDVAIEEVAESEKGEVENDDYSVDLPINTEDSTLLGSQAAEEDDTEKILGECNQIGGDTDSQDYSESNIYEPTEDLIKEEFVENEYEEEYVTRTEPEQPSENVEYDVGDGVVKEEMADIDTLVDVKQEVLEECDHLALDHVVKQEYLDPDGTLKEEYPHEEMCHPYYTEDKEVVPVALKTSSEFQEEMIVPASMISAADIKNMQDKNNEEIIISDKCVDVTKLNNIEMEEENEGDSLLAPRSFACSICHREYITIASLQRHEKIHDNGSATVTIAPAIEEDIVEPEPEIQNTEGLYKCSCSKGFKRRSSVIACMKTHRTKGIWCEQCGVSFRRRRDLHRHLLKEHINVPKSKSQKPKCEICNKEFAHQRSLARHTARLHATNEPMDGIKDGTEVNVKKCTCDLCDVEFETDLELSTHKSVAHPLPPTEDYKPPDEPRPASLKLKFNCKTCKKVFLTLGALASHKQLHSKKHNKMKFRCERCQECFQTRSELSSHRRLHCRGVLHHYSALQYITERDAVKPTKVKCDVCAHTYATKGDMEKHRDATHPFVTFSKEDATETRIFFK